MNWLDIAIVVAIGFAIFLGLRIGIIKAILSLGGLIAGMVLAGHYYAALSQQLSFISDENLAKIAAFAIILIGVTIAAAVMAYLLKRVTEAMMLGWVNRLGGAVFGLALGVLFCSTVLAIWIKLLGTPTIISESAMAAMLLDYFPSVLTLLPGELDGVRSFFSSSSYFNIN